MNDANAESVKIETNVYRAYEKWSRTYDSQPNPTRDLNALVLRRLVPDLDGLRVVEGGCGTGINSAWLAPRCKQLIGLDFSDGMLRIAKRRVRLPHAWFIRHDIRESWPLREAIAELVLISLVLEHIELLEPVLRNAAQVMRHGALLIISEFHPDRVAAGARARIGSEDEDIINFLHPVEEYTDAANAVGLRLNSVAEWSKDLLDVRQTDVDGLDPLILSLCFEKP